MKKTLILLVAVLLVAGGVFAYLQYNKPHRDTEAAAAAFALPAPALYSQFQEDEKLANEQYLDKVVLVKGTVAGTSETEDGSMSVLLNSGDDMFGVSCKLLPEAAEKLALYQTGDSIQVKGICTGLLMDVVLVRGVIVD